MTVSNFNINLPLVAPTTSYPTTPSLLPTNMTNAILNPTQTTGIGVTDSFTASASSIAQPLAVGAAAGYKAPRGIQHVRQKLNINQYGQSSRSYSTRGGGYGRSNYGYNSNSYRSNSYGQRSYRSNSLFGGRAGVGQSNPFGIGAALKSSVLFGGLISVALNGYSFFNKTESGATAGANITGDVVSAGISGMAAAGASYIGVGMIAAMGAGGGLLTVAGLALGIGGYWVADKLLRSTSLFQGMQQGVYKLFGGT